MPETSTHPFRKTSSLFRWVPEEVPHSLLEVHGAGGDSASFALPLLDEGWTGLLLEYDPTAYPHIRDLWKQHAGVSYADLSAPDSGTLAHTSLQQLNFPQEFGIAILNFRAGKAILARELLDSGYRPWLFALKDENEPASERFIAYSLLTRNQYRFAGNEQGFSIWSRLTSLRRTSESEVLHTLSSAPLAEKQGEGFFDLPTSEGRFTATGHLSLRVAGWAFESTERPIPPLVYIERVNAKTGQIDYVLASRSPRVDVANHFGNPALVMCGFEADIPMHQFYPEGFTLKVLQSDGDCYIRNSAALLVTRGNEDFEQTARSGLARKFLRGAGIEVGALQRKLVLPPSCSVRYVDRLSLDDLLGHYPELAGFPLQTPDIIDDGESLHSIAPKSLDFVIANHFFEHCENPIQALQNLLAVLKRGGILYLAVPDKRYTFDWERPSTDFASLRATYLNGKRADRAKLYQEWVCFVERCYEDPSGQRCSELLRTNYSIHYNVWSADELLCFLIQARQEFTLSFNISSIVCVDNEAIVLLEQSA